MKKSLSKAAAIFGFAALALTAHAQDKGSKEMCSMGGMKMDCTKNMGSMKGMEGMEGMHCMKMDCLGKSATKEASNALPVNADIGRIPTSRHSRAAAPAQRATNVVKL